MQSNPQRGRLDDLRHELDSLAERRLLAGLDPVEQTRWNLLAMEEAVLISLTRTAPAIEVE